MTPKSRTFCILQRIGRAVIGESPPIDAPAELEEHFREAINDALEAAARAIESEPATFVVMKKRAARLVREIKIAPPIGMSGFLSKSDMKSAALATQQQDGTNPANGIPEKGR